MSPPRTSNDPRSRGTLPRDSTVPYTRHLTVMSGNAPVKSIKPISNSVVGRSVEVEDTAVLLALTGANGELLRVLAKETGAEISKTEAIKFCFRVQPNKSIWPNVYWQILLHL